MCIFSGAVEQVAETELFARLFGTGGLPRQALVYRMQFSAADELAMLLPLPVPSGSPEDCVQFVSLEDYPAFFDDLAKGFPSTQPRSRSNAAPTKAAAPLVVQDVGAYDASFVPTAADFGRLDARFRLPPDAASSLPIPDDYGYAVFKLKPGQQQRVHPLALTFPTRNPNHLFFPATHLHGTGYEKRALFDHTLYFQGSDALRLPLSFDMKTGRFGRLAGSLLGVGAGTTVPDGTAAPAKDFVQTNPERGLVDPDLKVYRFRLQGRLPNRDVTLWPKYHANAGEYA